MPIITIFSIIKKIETYRYNNKALRLLFALALLLCFSNLNLAQRTDYIIRHITKENGLVSNQVSSVLLDSKGYVWIGTQTGLQRYDGKRFNTYTADVHDPEALQSDWINTIFEDSRHRLWIGTSLKGPAILNRNTDKFYNFNLHLAAGGKKINGVWQFLEDTKGRIWLSAFDGYYKFDEASQQFQPANDLLKMERTASSSRISMDKQGNIWFSTTRGAKKLSVNTDIVYDRNNNPDHLALFDIPQPINSITFDASDNVWLSTGYEHNLYRYTSRNNQMKKYSFNRLKETLQPGLPEVKEFIGEVFICSNGQLLLPLFSRGLAFYNARLDSFVVMNADNNAIRSLHMDRNSFSGITIREDKERNIWLSTDAGINIFNLDKARFAHYGIPANFYSGEVSGAIQTANGDIYTSNYYANGGINLYDSNLNFKQQFLWKGAFNYDADNNQVWGVFQDRTGVIWAPNQAGNILQLHPGSSEVTLLADTTISGAINQVIQDNDGNIWIGHDRRGLFKIDAMSKKITSYTEFLNPEPGSRRRIMCMLADKDKIWVGTILNGLQLFNKVTGKFIESFKTNDKDKQSITDNNITSIISYNEDTLILGTNGGINIFDKKKKTFSSILSRDGLPNNLVQSVILDNNRNLWAACAGGLSKINIHTLRITNYDESDGIFDNRFNPSFLKLRDGRLLVGGSKSFLVFDPAKLAAAKIPADVTITGFKVFGKTMHIDTLVNTSAAVNLSYTENSVNIELASLQYTSSRALKYYYQLEGADKDWVLADNDHSVHYNQLPPGHYVFKVKVANKDGVFSNNITSLAINIIPPFWETWWFIALASILTGAIIIAFVKWREKNYKLIESNKTKVQQLTAENYKTQFEAEQISTFFTTSLLTKNDIDDVLWDVAKNLIGKLGFVDCVIYLWNADKTKMIQKAGYGPKGSLEEFQKRHFDVSPGQGVVGAVIQSGETILISDTTMDQRYRVDDIRRQSELCVPIHYNNQLLGVIDSEHHEKGFFTRQHVQVLNTIATLVASKIKSIEADQRLRHQKAQLADVNDRLAEVQLNALRGQMNPHFIFNALNSIKKFVIANEPVNAEKYLGKFSKLIRSILDNSRSGMVTVEKELQLLHLYLDLEQLRFGSKLSYTITVDEDLHPGDIEIPSMIVQPFVENAMLHGIMHREDGGQVTINFILHKAWLEIIIEDNGVGRKKSAAYKSDDSEPHHSIGIEVATKRLKALKKNEDTPAGIQIVDVVDATGEGSGTKVIISIPIY